MVLVLTLVFQINLGSSYAFTYVTKKLFVLKAQYPPPHHLVFGGNADIGLIEVPVLTSGTYPQKEPVPWS